MGGLIAKEVFFKSETDDAKEAKGLNFIIGVQHGVKSGKRVS